MKHESIYSFFIILIMLFIPFFPLQGQISLEKIIKFIPKDNGYPVILVENDSKYYVFFGACCLKDKRDIVPLASIVAKQSLDFVMLSHVYDDKYFINKELIKEKLKTVDENLIINEGVVWRYAVIAESDYSSMYKNID